MQEEEEVRLADRTVYTGADLQGMPWQWTLQGQLQEIPAMPPPLTREPVRLLMKDDLEAHGNHCWVVESQRGLREEDRHVIS